MSSSSPSRANKLAVVTGAAGVLGEAIARMLVEEEGYIVAAVDRRPEGLEALVQALGRDNVVPFPVDITDHEAVEKACRQIIDRLGPVTILVNNAGILTNNKIAETTADEWDSIFAVNVKGAMLMSQQLLPAMRAQRYGRVVNITSMAAKSGGVTAGTAYAASKGALQSLTFSLAREVSRDGVTVNAIAPAYVKTPMVTEHLTEHQRAHVIGQIPEWWHGHGLSGQIKTGRARLKDERRLDALGNEWRIVGSTKVRRAILGVRPSALGSPAENAGVQGDGDHMVKDDDILVSMVNMVHNDHRCLSLAGTRSTVMMLRIASSSGGCPPALHPSSIRAGTIDARSALFGGALMLLLTKQSVRVPARRRSKGPAIHKSRRSWRFRYGKGETAALSAISYGEGSTLIGQRSMDVEDTRQVSSLTRLLVALEYPRAQQFALADPTEVSKTVSFAEDRKIRLYDIDERAPLRKPGPQWPAAFQKYLKDLGCPHDWSDISGTDQIKALRWFLSKALSCEYMDAAEQYNEAAAVSSAAKADAGALPPPPPGDTGLLHDDFPLGVEALAVKVGVHAGGEILGPILKMVFLMDGYGLQCGSLMQAILSAVQTKLSVAAMDAVKEGTAQRLQLDDFPLSYTTGDDVVDRVARALTLLYVTDLREVQNDINDILVSAQEFTANPKTNTALGKVGR